ncbi:F-box domain-containing protein [Mycena venus]|uniref:F-box domain-containing protein n=1 Tax=Mycena venus TaxID=2733690 RepID=A0A8H7D8S9_9AGAR|nr:F-box domain-containing protein [Mycena venus]
MATSRRADFLDKDAVRENQVARTSPSKVQQLFRKIKSNLNSVSSSGNSQIAVLDVASEPAENSKTGLTDNPVLPILLEQAERTSGWSKAEIRLLVEEYESQISSLDSEKAIVHFGSISKLRDHYRIIISVLRYLVAPVRPLPVELLAEIFVLTMPALGEEGGGLPSSWRRGFRQLYTRLALQKCLQGIAHLHALETDRAEYPAAMGWPMRSGGSFRDVDGMKAWLARSEPLPIPISIYTQREDWREYEHLRPFPALLDELLQISPRWRSLHVQNPLPPSFFRRLAENGLDSLEELDITRGLDVHHPDHLDDDSEILSFVTPRLRSVSMDLKCRFSIPWTQLSDIRLSYGLWPDKALDILAQCTNLVTASISTAGWPSTPPPRTKLITLAHLHTLHLVFTETDPYFMPFLGQLSAPALKHFRLYSTPYSIWAKADFTAFQLRSENITHFELTDSSPTPDDLSTALIYAPSLTHLKVLSPRCIDDNLLRALTLENGTQPLVPCLHDLTLLELRSSWLSEDVLISMILSRWWTDAELASHSALPSVARWTRINMTFTRSNRGSAAYSGFTNIMRDLRHQGLNIMNLPFE